MPFNKWNTRIEKDVRSLTFTSIKICTFHPKK